MPVRKLREFLDREKVKYVVLSHSPAFTAQEIAAATHTPGKDLAKTVMVRIDGRLAMAVLPATRRVDLRRLARAAGGNEAELASEGQFKETFPDCDVGAMPPFGNLYGVEVYADARLAADPEIGFNAGTHTELVRMAWTDFARLAKPKVVEIAQTTP